MSLTLTTPPTVEPLTINEAKHHVRVFHSADDCYLGELITAARIKWETETGYYLSEAEFTYTCSASSVVTLPLRPVLSVESVNELASEDYGLHVDPLTGVGTLTITGSVDGELEIAFKVGFETPETTEGDDGQPPHPAPALCKHALKTLISHWYNNREASTDGAMGGGSKSVPYSYQSIVQNYRIA